MGPVSPSMQIHTVCHPHQTHLELLPYPAGSSDDDDEDHIDDFDYNDDAGGDDTEPVA